MDPGTPFGTTVETGFLSTPGSTGNVLWGPALAALNSDGDALTNGQELQDPAGAWSTGQPNPGNPALVKRPGVADAMAVPAVPPSGVALIGLFLLGFGVTSLGRKARQKRP